METILDSQFNNDTKLLPERPAFLKVLCILTWICCGILFLTSLPQIFKQPSVEEQQLNVEKLRSLNPEAANKMEALVDIQSPAERVIYALLNIVAIALSAYGAFLMWKLKKSGFYLYLLGEALPYVAILANGTKIMSVIGAMAGGMGSMIAGAGIFIMALFDLVFIIMYAVNLKYMTK